MDLSTIEGSQRFGIDPFSMRLGLCKLNALSHTLENREHEEADLRDDYGSILALSACSDHALIQPLGFNSPPLLLSAFHMFTKEIFSRVKHRA